MPHSSGSAGPLVVRGGYVVAADHVGSADVVCRDGLIEEIDPGATAASRHPSARIVDVTGELVLPGLTNGHTHSYGTLCRHDGAGRPLEPWMNYALARTVGRSRAEVRIAAQLQAIEAIRTGTTALIDHVGGRVDDLDAVLEAYEEIGIRAVVAPMIGDLALPATVGAGPQDWTPGSGHDDAAFVPPPAAELVDATLALHASWNSPTGRTSVAFGPSAPQRCTPELLELVAEEAGRRGMLVHTHLLETRLQRSLTPPRGASWVEHLDRCGLLGPRTSTSHNVWVDEAELELLADRGVTLVHNPQSNMQIGSGIADLGAWRRAGVSIALGTDSANCGGSMDLLSSMRLAVLVHRVGNLDPRDWETPAGALQLATDGGARVLGLGAGGLRPGTRADFATFSMRGPVYASGEDPLATLVLGAWDHSARTVVVNGDVVLADGRFTTIDEDAVLASAAPARAAMVERNAALDALARSQEGTLTRLSTRAPAPRPIVPVRHPATLLT